MIAKSGSSLIFYAHYVNGGTSATGLTVTVDIWEVQRDGTAAEIVTAGAATEIGDGLYRYLLASGSVDAAAEYISVFKTAGTVDQEHLPAIWTVDRNVPEAASTAIGAAGAGLTALGDTRLAYLTGPVATAAKLLSYVQSMLRSDVTVDTDIGGTYDDATDSQQAISDNAGSAASVWTYATRTLTQGAASVIAAVTGSSVTAYRGTRWSITLTGLTDMTGQTGVWFGVKANGREDADTASICLVKTTTGLIAFAGDDTITAGHAAITVNSSTSITITVEADATQYATPGQYEYAVKALNASGKPFMVSSGGSFAIVSDIPMAIS